MDKKYLVITCEDDGGVKLSGQECMTQIEAVTLPQKTTTERGDINEPVEGALIWNTTTKRLNVYDGTDWQEVALSIDITA